MNISTRKTVSIGLCIAFASALATVNVQSEELPARGPIPFAAYDKDGNSFISEAEFNAVRGERLSARAAEGRPMRGLADVPEFSDFDVNGDGQLSPTELAAGQKTRMEQRRSMRAGRGRGMGRNMPSFSKFDLNRDGQIVEEEFNKARAQRITERAEQGYQMKNLGRAPSFSEIDANGDGRVGQEEFAAHQQQHRQQINR